MDAPAPRSPKEPSNDFSLTLSRGIQILEIFSPETPEVTTSEVAERIGISRAAVRRLLLTLTTMGYLKQSKSNFSLTDKIATIGHGHIARQARWASATADVIELANRLNEPISISVLDGFDIRFVARDHKRRIFSSRLVVGDKLPAHCSAAGKVLLASLRPEALDDLLARAGALKQNTPNSITDHDKLRQELKRVRIQSWASAEDEMEVGTISVAVPIFDSGDNVIAALALGSHKMRRTMDELRTEFLPILLDTADKISSKIG